MAETQYTLKELCEELDIEPLEVLEAYSPRQRKEKSLRVTLERSFEMLSVEAQDLFPLLAFFPGGMSRDLAKGVWGRNGNRAVLELFKFSMAEKSSTSSDWRVNLPEPARSYAESKLQPGRKLDDIAPLVLNFYHESFCDKVIQLFKNNKDKEAQDLLLQESSNLIRFLQWGYDHENSTDNICRSARITALLSYHWRWLEPNQDPLARLDLALVTAKRNQDKEGEILVEDAVRKVISTLPSTEEFQDAKFFSKENNQLKSCEFETVTVNNRGEEITRELHSDQYFTGIKISHNFDNLPNLKSLLKTLLDYNYTSLEMVSIPGGTFMMGSPEGEGYDNEKPQHQVTLKPFFMGKYPITQAQWRAVAKLPKIERDLELNPAYFQGDNRPVERVSWHYAVEFCARLSQAKGREYRLPSEAEWEYACRARTTTPFHFGDTITSYLANYNASKTFTEESKWEEYRKQTTLVGSFPPNAFGLYDMHGNIWEWCADHWHRNYQGAPIDGSSWQGNNNIFYCLLRGGSWFNLPEVCRSAYRNLYNLADVFGYGIGFRVCCGVPRSLE